LAPWPFRDTDAGATPILLAYSPHILARPPDWPSWAHVTGYWQLQLDARWAPPEALVHFLESGPAPIYFGPGSVRTGELRRLLSTVVSSARVHGQRMVLGVPPQALDAELGGPDVFAAEGIPHAWLFPKMRYILHHGGAGTTGAAARAGIPNTAIPFSADQAFWARQIRRLGVGPAAPAARHLTRSHLEVILQDVLVNPGFARRARTLRQELLQEDGVASALQVIQTQLGFR
jgi:UDP:flavonoid glycosyltransferase YjiC (YdhE family)